MHYRPRRGSILRAAEHQRRVVLDPDAPEMRVQECRMQRKRPREPVDEIEEMHSLVDELPAARASGIGPPLTLVSSATSVPVVAAQMHQIAVAPGMDFLGEPSDCRMETVVEADLDESGDPSRCLGQPSNLQGAEPCRLL